jgi:hypothetical protein
MILTPASQAVLLTIALALLPGIGAASSRGTGPTCAATDRTIT